MTGAGSRLRDIGLAGALAGAMTLVWSVRAQDRLPDTDDAARLAQIRDWLTGQPFGDLSQHRFGIDGVAMHWSRLPDLVPAAMLKLGIGEGVMLALWPGLLFAAFLYLSTRLARAIGAPPIEALILATLAYPATTLFAPGRIDHHGLQMVLLAAMALGLVTPERVRGGIAAGAVAALSIGIGMESAPIIAIAAAALVLRWSNGLDDERLGAFAASLLIGIAALAALFAPDGWARASCDGFTSASTAATAIGGAALIALWGAGHVISDRRARMGVAALMALAAGAVLLLAAPGCLSPYGAVDPMLSRLWLSQVGEAQPLMAADPRWAIAYAGIGIFAICAAPFAVRRWEAFLIVALIAAGLTTALVQLRGAYAAAALAPSIVALAIARVRRVSPLLALPLWVAGAGIVWPLAATLVPEREDAPPGAPCDDIAQARRMRSLPPGRVLGPIDLGPWLLVETRHHAIAASYHRNAAGNLAAYRLFASPPEAAVARARAVKADYLVACPAARAAMGFAPDGWRPDGAVPTGIANVWRVR